MKKIVAILLLACMMVGLVACGASEAEYKLGMGAIKISSCSVFLTYYEDAAQKGNMRECSAANFPENRHTDTTAI